MARIQRRYAMAIPKNVQEQMNLRPTAVNKQTPTIFALNYLTRHIVEQFYVLNSPEQPLIGENISETSMLDDDTTREKLAVFEKIKKKYKNAFDTMGGANGVLKDLQNFIVAEITRLDARFANAAIDPSKRKFEVDEADKDLGMYKTALRALLDKQTIFWPSLFHTGATRSYGNIPFREMLAYYWLAASDKDMDIEYDTKEEKEMEIPPNAPDREKRLKENEERQKRNAEARAKERREKLEFAKKNFPTVLSQIRRDHNEGDTTLNPIDNPTCPPGTFGKLASSSVAHNLVARVSDPYNSTELGDQVMIFIKNQYSQLSQEDKIKIARYLSEGAIIGIEGSPEDKAALEGFINKLLESDKINQLMEHIEKNSHEFRFLFKNPKPEQRTQIRNIIVDFVNVHAQSLLAPPDFPPKQLLLNGILEQGFEGGAVDAIAKGFSELKDIREKQLMELRGKVYEFTTKLLILKQKILHEHAMALLMKTLDPDMQYPIQENVNQYVEKMKKLNEEFKEYEKKQNKSFEERARAIMKEQKDKLPATSEEFLAKFDENIDKVLKTVVKSLVPETTRNRMKFNEEMIAASSKLATASSNRLVSQLPVPPGMAASSLSYNKIDDWANYFIALASGTYKDKSVDKETLKELREADRAIMKDILMTKLDFIESENREKIGAQIKTLLEDPAVLTRLRKSDPENINMIKEVLGSEVTIGIPKEHRSIDYGLESFKNEAERKQIVEVSKKKIFVGTNFNFEGDTKPTRSDINKMKDNKKAETEKTTKNLEEWQKTAISLLSTGPDGKADLSEEAIRKLKSFVFLTVCNNLDINHTHTLNIETLEWLTDLYMGNLPNDEQMDDLLFSKEAILAATPQQKVAYLSAHIANLLTTMEGLKLLFESGNLTLLSRDQAEKAVKFSVLSGEADPFIIRVSNADPNRITSTRKTDLSGDIPATLNPVTATLVVPNVPNTFEIRKMYNKDIDDWIKKQRLLEKTTNRPAVTKSVFGSIAVEEITSDVVPEASATKKVVQEPQQPEQLLQFRGRQGRRFARQRVFDEEVPVLPEATGILKTSEMDNRSIYLKVSRYIKRSRHEDSVDLAALKEADIKIAEDEKRAAEEALRKPVPTEPAFETKFEKKLESNFETKLENKEDEPATETPVEQPERRARYLKRSRAINDAVPTEFLVPDAQPFDSIKQKKESELKARADALKVQQNTRAQSQDTKKLIQAAFESLKPLLKRNGYQEPEFQEIDKRKKKIQEMQAETEKNIKQEPKGTFRIVPAIENNEFIVIGKNAGGIVENITCRVVPNGIMVHSNSNNYDFRVDNFNQLENQINKRLAKEPAKLTKADLERAGKAAATGSEAKETSQLAAPSKKQLFIFDFDLTIVNEHWHNILKGDFNANYGYLDPNDKLIDFLLNEMKENVKGIKNEADLRNLMRTILNQGHHLAVLSKSKYPGVVRQVLSRLGLTEEEVNRVYTDPDLFSHPTEDKNVGRNPEIIETMLSFGIYDPKRVTLIDDDENNLKRAAELGVTALNALETPKEKSAPAPYIEKAYQRLKTEQRPEVVFSIASPKSRTGSVTEFKADQEAIETKKKAEQLKMSINTLKTELTHVKVENKDEFLKKLDACIVSVGKIPEGEMLSSNDVMDIKKVITDIDGAVGTSQGKPKIEAALKDTLQLLDDLKSKAKDKLAKQ